MWLKSRIAWMQASVENAEIPRTPNFRNSKISEAPNSVYRVHNSFSFVNSIDLYPITMLTIRICQILFVFVIGAFAALVTWNNLRDPKSNLRFVQHLMSMDTVFPDSRLKARAIVSAAWQRLFFGLIVACEGLTALLCFGGAALLGANLDAPVAAFQATKWLAFTGLATGFALWFGGFMVIGGQWFASWQSKDWNGRESAFMFYTAIGLVFVVLLHPA